MPVDSILVCGAVIAVFAVFSAVLIWGDLQSGSSSGEPATFPRKRRSFDRLPVGGRISRPCRRNREA